MRLTIFMINELSATGIEFRRLLSLVASLGQLWPKIVCVSDWAGEMQARGS